MDKRRVYIKAMKAVVESKRGHEMGNVVNVSPFAQKGTPKPVEFTVHSRCRKCGRGMYMESVGGELRSWGDAVQANCG